MLPLQVEDEWRPNPPRGGGHLDKDQSALGYIDLVCTPSRVRVDCCNKSVEEIASLAQTSVDCQKGNGMGA